MSIENFFWDNEKHIINWSYKRENFKIRIENLNFASIQNSYVYAEAGSNFSQDQIYYFSFEGKHIFVSDRVLGKVSWQFNNHSVNIHLENVLNAQFYIEKDIIMVITAINQKDKKILGFALDGTLLFEKEPPKGYYIMYLSRCNNLPSVVCDGAKLDTDPYGRNNWHFIIDLKNGEMSKGSLAY